MRDRQIRQHTEYPTGHRSLHDLTPCMRVHFEDKPRHASTRPISLMMSYRSALCALFSMPFPSDQCTVSI